MMTNALYQFEGEFSLLSGDGETPFFKSMVQRAEKLREINEWRNAPQKGGVTSV